MMKGKLETYLLIKIKIMNLYYRIGQDWKVSMHKIQVGLALLKQILEFERN